MSQPLFACRDLSKHFGGLAALDGLTLSVGAGETVGLVGPNGSGKTTFFNVATGLYRPTGGALSVAGADLFDASPQRIHLAGVSRTFQRSRLDLSATVFDNIAVGSLCRLSQGVGFNLFRRRAWRAELEELAEASRAVLRRFSPALGDKLFEPTGALPMIDRRRIEICRALVSRPRLLLLDEPSAGMTPDEARRLLDEVLYFREAQPDLAVVLVEHEMDVIGRVSDRCVVLNFGRKIFEGGFQEMIGSEDVQTAYLGSAA